MNSFSIVKYVFAIVGAGMLLGAGAMRAHTSTFLAHASAAQGTVVALQPKRSSDNGSTTYSPVVRFEHDGQMIEFTSQTSSSPPAYHVDEIVPVLYLDTNPYDAKLNAFFSLWGGVVILGGLGAVFLLIGGGMILVPLRRKRADDYLAHEGVPVEADIQSVGINTAVSVSGRNPFRIVAQWQDPATSQVHVFESHNIWFDPSSFIKQKSVRVFIDRTNPKKYYVDVSFLPQLAN
jgi:hypothetical protein